jgi:(1->4)-alpha-D-glucan 1-alpha-D-glucosylmutase
VEAYVRGVVTAGSPVLAEIDRLARVTSFHGMWSALSQTLLKLTSPGVPDCYQGTEVWDFSLVDPDNRRPVDYAARKAMLEELARRRGEGIALARDLVMRATDGRIKMFVTHTVLEARDRLREAFGPRGSYEALTPGGTRAEHVVALARSAGSAEIVVIAPRLTARLAEGHCRAPTGAVWSDTNVPVIGNRYRNVFTGVAIESRVAGARRTIAVASALAEFPIALLERVPQ